MPLQVDADAAVAEDPVAEDADAVVAVGALLRDDALERIVGDDVALAGRRAADEDVRPLAIDHRPRSACRCRAAACP